MTLLKDSNGTAGLSFVDLDARLDTALEVNVRDYSGLHPNVSTDSVSAINTAIAAASALATARSAPFARLGGFGNNVYRVDGRIIAKSNVHLEFDEARIYAGADFSVPSNCMFRAPETSTAAVSVGTGTTVNGSKIITGISSIASYYPEMVITGTGIAANTKVVAVDVEFSKIAIDTAATASGTVTLTRATTLYGTYNNFRISGGEIDPNQKNIGGPVMRLHYMKNFAIVGTRILHNLPAGHQNWAIQYGGRGTLVQDCEIIGGNGEFADGIHLDHGQYHRIIGNHIESGDDMIALGAEPGDIFDTEPDPIRHVRISGNTGRSNMAYALKIYCQSGNTGRDWEVSDVTADIDGASSVTDRGGLQSCGGIRIDDNNSGASGTSQLKRITINLADVAVGSALMSGALLGQAIHVSSADDVTINGSKGTIENGPAPAVGLDVIRVEKSRDVTISGVNASLTNRYGLYATDSERVTLKDCRLLAVSGSGNPVRLSNCSDFKVVNNTLYGMASGQAAIRINEGTTSSGSIRGNRAGNAGGDAFLLLHTAAAVTSLDVDDNDARGCTRTFESVSEWATTVRPVFPASPPRRLFTGRNRFDATGAGTTTLSDNGAGAFAGTVPAYAAVYLDPADMVAGARSVKLRMELMCLVNNVAPTCNIGVALVAVSAPAGAAGTISLTQGSTVSGSTVTATTPAANSSTRSTADFTLPVAGWYATVAIIGGAGMAASSSAFVRANIYVIEGI